MPSESTRWAALLLKRRLDSASSDEERQQVLRDIERSRKDPQFRARLGQIAEHGKWSSGAPLKTKMALAAGTLATPLFPPLGIASGLGLAALAVPTGREAWERRSEGLPWKWQAAESALDLGFPAGARLLRGLKGVKEVAPRIGPRVVSPGSSLPRELVFGKAGSVDLSPPRRVGDRVISGEFPRGEGLNIAKEGDFSEFLEKLSRPQGAIQAEQLNRHKELIRSGRPGQPPRIKEDVVPAARSRVPEVEVGRYDPETATWVGGKGTGLLPLKMQQAIRKRQLAKPDPSGRRSFDGTRTWASKRKTKAREALNLAHAENTASRRLGREPQHSQEALKKLKSAAKLEVETNKVFDEVENSRQSISARLRLKVPTIPGASPVTVAATQVGKNIEKVGDDIVKSTSRTAAQADEVVGGGARQEGQTPMEVVERRATIDPILAKDAAQMQALDEVALIIGQAGDETFEAFGLVGPKLTRTAVTSPEAQRGLLRELVATQYRPIQKGKKGSLVEGPEGSSVAYMFGHRPASRPVGDTRPKFKVFESGRGPGSESKRSEGPQVIETWFGGQGKIFGTKAFAKTKRLNGDEVRQFAAKLHDEGEKSIYTKEMINKTRSTMTPTEVRIHDQAVMFSIIAQRAGMLKKVMARTTGMPSRIKEFRGKGKEAILHEMTGAYQTFMKESTFKERQSIIDAANEYTEAIAMLLASIAGAEMMELSGDPRASAR